MYQLILGLGKKRDTSGTKAIHNCDSCGKSFTTKFNLKRHINMHCHKSRENGVPIQVINTLNNFN